MIPVDTFFQKYVFGFIFTDIEREIALGATEKGGGNLLAALGLLCYTEFMGGFVTGKIGQGLSKKNFDAFLHLMGSDYRALSQRANVYDVFRCGMAHEYLVKGNCGISMLKGTAPCGLQEAGGEYHFNVEKYFEDFGAACRQLHADLIAQPNPTLPTRVSPKKTPQKAGKRK